MRNFTRKNVIIFIMIIALISSCMLNIVQFVGQKNEREKAEEEKGLIDSEYKLFYGEWEIKKFINFTASIPIAFAEKGEGGQPPKDIIGTKIFFDRDKILNNDKIVCTDPIYTISIIPILKNGQQFLGERSMSIKDLRIKGEYFNFITVKDGNFLNLDDVIGTEFYIVDNNTLILEYKACEFVMKRTAFIENAYLYEKEHS